MITPRFLRLLAASAMITLLASCESLPSGPSSIALADTAAPVATTQPTAVHTPSIPANFVNAHAIIIVRHADIVPAQKSSMGNAAPLTDRGMQRAKELAFALKDAGVTRIITSQALRTQQTAEVLAKELHITPEIPFQKKLFMADNAPKVEYSTVVGYLAHKAKPADIILVVYHHSVIPSILEELGYKDDPPIGEAEFDRLYLVLPNPATHTYRILRLRYGGNWGQNEAKSP